MIKIFRILHAIFVWTVAFLASFLALLIIGPISWLVRDRKGIYQLGCKAWAKILLALTNIRIKVIGHENIYKKKNYIFVSNHESSLDILALAAVLSHKFLFVMREELFKIPFIGKGCKNAGYLPLSIKKPMKSYRDLQKIIDTVKDGESIVYFPEGGRKKGLQEFKSGFAKIVLETQIPAIPIAISGSGKLMPRKSFIFSPGVIKVYIGKPIRFGKNETDQEVTNKIRKTIADKLRNSTESRSPKPG